MNAMTLYLTVHSLVGVLHFIWLFLNIGLVYL